VVPQLSRDDLGLGGLVAKLPVCARDFNRALVRFGAARREEETIDAGIRQSGQTLGELDRAQVRASDVSRRVPQRLELVARGFRQLAAAVTERHVPQPREAVDVFLAIGVDQHGAVTADPDVSGAMGFRVVKRMNQRREIPRQ
jgi:hypothetical protein